MKQSYIKAYKTYKKIKKQELNLFLFKVFKKDNFINIHNLQYKLNVKNCCITTGRARSVNRYFKISRMGLKDMIITQRLHGVRKAS